jgi:hypothetical protein
LIHSESVGDLALVGGDVLREVFARVAQRGLDLLARREIFDDRVRVFLLLLARGVVVEDPGLLALHRLLAEVLDGEDGLLVFALALDLREGAGEAAELGIGGGRGRGGGRRRPRVGAGRRVPVVALLLLLLLLLLLFLLFRLRLVLLGVATAVDGRLGARRSAREGQREDDEVQRALHRC